MSEPAFTYVERKKKKKKNRQGKAKESLADLLERTSGSLAADSWSDRCILTIETFRQGLKGDITMPRQCLCLGLGSPIFSRNSRAQLDTLLSICKQYNIRHEDVTIADPAFHPEDVEGLNALGFVVTSVLGNGQYDVIPPILLYMPHCDLRLHEEIFRHNWNSDRLDGLFIIANDLNIYRESMPQHKLQVEAPLTARLIPYLCVQRLPLCTPFPEAFNDVAIQWIPDDGTLPSDVWGETPEEPSIPSAAAAAAC